MTQFFTDGLIDGLFFLIKSVCSLKSTIFAR